MRTSGMSAEILGGVANINVQTTGGDLVHATVQGAPIWMRYAKSIRILC